MFIRRIAVAAAATVAGLASGCSLPDRSNPYDSVNRPNAQLSLSNASPALTLGRIEDDPDTGLRDCSQNLDPSTLTTFARGRCLIADATASEPGESASDRWNEVRFSFFDALTDTVLHEIVLTETTSARAAIAGVDIPNIPWLDPSAHPDGQQRELVVRLFLEDSDGNRAVTEDRFTLIERPPKIVEPRPLFLQDESSLWAGPGEDVAIRFDASRSSDPDEDRLFYCWEDADQDTSGLPLCHEPGAIFTTTSSHVVFSPPLTSAGLRQSVTLVVSDGVYRTQRVTGTAVSGNTPKWGYEEDSGSLVQVDVRRNSSTLPDQVQSVVAAISGGSIVPEVAYRRPGAEDEIVFYNAGVGTTNAGIDFSTEPLIGSGARIREIVPSFTPGFSPPSPPNQYSRRLWVLLTKANDEVVVALLEREDLQPTYTLHDVWAPTQPLALFSDDFVHGLDQVSRDDHFGDLWFASHFGDRVFGLHFNWATKQIEQLDEIEVPDGLIPTGIGVQGVYNPGTQLYEPELWILFSRNVLEGGNIELPVAYVRTTDFDPCAPERWLELDEEAFGGDVPAVAWGLAFAFDSGGATAIWTNLFAHGLALLRIEEDTSTTEPCDATLTPQTLVPDVAVGFELATIPATGQVAMVEDGGNSLVRVLSGGALIRMNSEADIIGIWSNKFNSQVVLVFEAEYPGDSATLVFTVGGGKDGVTVRRHLNPSVLEKARSIDGPTGYMWIASILPAEIVMVDAAGEVVDQFDNVGTDGNAFGPPMIVRADPDSGMVAFFTGNLATDPHASKIYVVDPRKTRPELGVMQAADGFVAPVATDPSNIPLGYRISDAVWQPSPSGSALLALAVDPADGDAYRLVRFAAPAMTSFDEDIPVDIPPGTNVALARDIATGQVSLAYESVTSGNLVIERFTADLSASTVHDLGVGGEPYDLSCLQGRCYVVFEDGDGDPSGVAQVDASDVEYVFDGGLDELPFRAEGIHVLYSTDSFPRIVVTGDQEIVRLQAFTDTFYPEEAFATDGRIRLYDL